MTHTHCVLTVNTGFPTTVDGQPCRATDSLATHGIMSTTWLASLTPDYNSLLVTHCNQPDVNKPLFSSWTKEANNFDVDNSLIPSTA